MQIAIIIFLICIILFIFDFFSPSTVAMLGCVMMICFGVCSPAKALVGFTNDIVLIVFGTEIFGVVCLCIVPAYQGKGIGTQAICFIKTQIKDWRKLTLVTPISKKQNVKFYTEKCGFHIESTEMDGNVKLARFILDR